MEERGGNIFKFVFGLILEGGGDSILERFEGEEREGKGKELTQHKIH